MSDVKRDHEALEEIEGGEAVPRRMRRASPLTNVEEVLMRNTTGCAISVHRGLGPGFLESIYKEAMSVELRKCGIAFEREVLLRVSYEGIDIGGRRLDLIVGGRIVVELTSIVHFDVVLLGGFVSFVSRG